MDGTLAEEYAQKNAAELRKILEIAYKAYQEAETTEEILLYLRQINLASHYLWCEIRAASVRKRKK